MNISVLLAGAGVCFGLLAVFAAARWNFAWRQRRWVAGVVYAVLLASSLFVAGSFWQSASLVIFYVFAAGVIAFLAARLQFGRLPEAELRRSTAAAALLFAAAIAGLVALFWFFPAALYLEMAIVGFLSGALFLACLFALQTRWALKHYSDARRTPAGWGSDPPTVTLAIPARNETHALAHCLDAALASNYPRLEILVLDDCSQDKTSQLIKSFAHAGVRFIQGSEPAKGWLGKTGAYATLEQEASGEYIAFMGVDTHLEPGAITQLTAYMETYSLGMLSVLPRWRGPYLLPRFLQHLRYVRQIIIPPKLGRIPVSSEMWLIKRDQLNQAGGFARFKRDILPEAELAAHFTDKRRYRFLLAGASLPISFGKRWSSQFETSTRLWYPLCGKQPLKALGLVLTLLVFGIGPFAALLAPSLFIQMLAGIICVIYLITYAAILKRLQPKLWWASVWLLPAVLAQEAALIGISMVKYEFSEVNWKGRNICYPVLLKR